MTVTLTDCDLKNIQFVSGYKASSCLTPTHTREPSLLSSPWRVCPYMLVYAHVYIYLMPDQGIVTITGKLAMFTKYYILWK